MGIRKAIYLVLSLVVIYLLSVVVKKADAYTASSEFCNQCHVHPQASTSWQQSMHHDDSTKTYVSCVACHLPPKGEGYYKEKVKTGWQHFYSYLRTDSFAFNWTEKSQPEFAVRHTFEASCIKCHPSLFPVHISKNGEEAHLHYQLHRDELHCINCHMDAGHGPRQSHTHNLALFQKTEQPNQKVYEHSSVITDFENFREQIPGSTVAFDMVVIPGGSYVMGSSRANAGEDEDTVRVTVSSFFMGKIEVTWDEYMAFLQQAESEGRIEKDKADVDGISGATPPWGNPDQGWGMGQRPAITMTHQAARVYCRWLSKVTGKKYRLATEAEWEYACRAGSENDFFWGSRDTTGELNRFVCYKGNAKGMTVLPDEVAPNPFGLINMSGNVKEFCLDNYDPLGYRNQTDALVDPVFINNGMEHVIRGGSFRSGVDALRASSREKTQHDNWLKTDPQIPKSVWWYSDCHDVGFRVVCEMPPELKEQR